MKNRLFGSYCLGPTRILVSTIVLLVLCGLQASAETAAGACSQTANRVLQSCRTGAESDYLLAQAKCANVPSDATCLHTSLAEKNDALQSCKEEFDVRIDACDAFGPDPYNPVINSSDFVSVIDNPLFPLQPGTTFIYEGQTAEGFEHDVIFVTHRKRVILGVPCTEVRDSVYLDGELAEDTLDWFAQDKEGNVWYFGENTHELDGRLITTIDGTFEAGENGAKPGIIMEASPHVGDFYRQEFDLANAEDFAKVTGVNVSVTVPYGSFTKCVKTDETTPLEPDLLESKIYCRGAGNVLEIDQNTGDKIQLIQIKTDSN